MCLILAGAAGKLRSPPRPLRAARLLRPVLRERERSSEVCDALFFLFITSFVTVLHFSIHAFVKLALWPVLYGSEEKVVV
jgi:hypothetical protein